MTTARQNPDAQGIGIMVLLCAVWGLQQVAIKVAAPDIAPIMQMAMRYGVSAEIFEGNRWFGDGVAPRAEVLFEKLVQCGQIGETS